MGTFVVIKIAVWVVVATMVACLAPHGCHCGGCRVLALMAVCAREAVLDVFVREWELADAIVTDCDDMRATRAENGGAAEERKHSRQDGQRVVSPPPLGSARRAAGRRAARCAHIGERATSQRHARPHQLGHTLALLSEGVGVSGCKLLPKSPRAKAKAAALKVAKATVLPTPSKAVADALLLRHKGSSGADH